MSILRIYLNVPTLLNAVSTSGMREGVGLQKGAIDEKSVTRRLSLDGGCFFTKNDGCMFSNVIPTSCGRERMPFACKSSNLF